MARSGGAPLAWVFDMKYRMRSAPALTALSSKAVVGSLTALLLLAACNDSDGVEPNDTAGGGGRGGTSHAGAGGSSGRASGGLAGESPGGAGLGGSFGASGGTPGDAAGEGGDAEGGASGAPEAPPIGVNRPERRDFSPALLAQLRLKPGFTVSVFGSTVSNARMLALGPTGDIYVTRPSTSEVTRLVDLNHDGDVDDVGERVVAANAQTTPALENVHGIAFNAGKVYLASTKSIVVGSVAADGSFTGLTPLVSDLPDGGQHPYRTLAVGPDGLLYVSVGSDCNACPESNSEHATLLRLNLDGSAAANPSNSAHPMLAENPHSTISNRVWASGLRNTIGFDWNPVSGALWGVDQGSDGLGEETPPEEFNILVGGKSYGWPYCWGVQNPDPTADDPSQTVDKQEYCATTAPSISGLPAHSSPIAFQFYRGGEFPTEYVNDAFLVLRGSWGRLVPEGYKVVRVHFQNGQLAPLPGSSVAYEDFLAGFLIEQGQAHFGRVAGLTFDATGALLVSDDTNGMIYRVNYGSHGPGGEGGAGGEGGQGGNGGDGGAGGSR